MIPQSSQSSQWAAYSQGKVPEARKAMERVLALVPESGHAAGAKTFLALTALEDGSGDPVAARAEIDKVLEADPKHVPALMGRAAILRIQGDPKAAAAIYAQALERFPDFAPAQKNLADIYADQPANRAKAYDLAMKARRTLSDDPELAQTLAVISFDRKEFPYALQLLQESEPRRPLDAKLLYVLGKCHLEARQKPEAKSALERAIAAGLAEPRLADARKILAEIGKQ